jgi:hypothetical protein
MRVRRGFNRVSDIGLQWIRSFGNAFSRGAAFRIFGKIATIRAKESRPRLRELLIGTSGLKALLEEYQSCVADSTPQSLSDSIVRLRKLDASCCAIRTACVYGYLEETLDLGICALIVDAIQLL